MWFPKIKQIQKLNLLKSGLNGGQKWILFFVHVSRIILILVANWQEIFDEWLINPCPWTKPSEVTLTDFHGDEPKNSKWPTPKTEFFNSANSQYFSWKFQRLVLEFRINWCKGHQCGSTYIVIRLSNIISKKGLKWAYYIKYPHTGFSYHKNQIIFGPSFS